MKINTTKELKTLDGRIIMQSENEKLTLGKAVANVLVTSENINKLKAYSLAQKFYNDAEVDIDEADFELVKQELEQSRAYNALIIGQILSIINK